MTTNIKPQQFKWKSYGSQNTAIGSSGQVLQSIGFSAQEVGPSYAFRDPEPFNIIFNAGDNQEMLKITKDGFYVRGVKVEQDEKEAAAVYKAFKRWMVETELRRQW